MKTWEKALAEVLERVAPLPAQRVPLSDARGRFLQEPAAATDDAPACDLSMMDGYAIGPEAAAGGELRVVGATRAGEPAGEDIRSGEARRIFTGAPLPGGAARVVPQEEVECLQETRILLRTIPDSLFVRPRGSEARAGEVILREGQRLGPAELAILAGLGLSEPAVGARPGVAHLVLGSELVDPADSPGPGQIRDTNSILIRSLIEENGARLAFQRRLADEPRAIRSAIEESHSDVLLVSGGASVGEHDHARSCLREAGFDFVFEGIRLRPGKPSAVGFRGNQVAICLPGNPVAHLAVFHLLVRPVLGKLAGATNPWPFFYEAPLLASLPGKSNPRHTFWPAVHGPDGLRPLRFLSSGDVLALAGVNAMISLEADATLPLVGTRVPFLPLHPAL